MAALITDNLFLFSRPVCFELPLLGGDSAERSARSLCHEETITAPPNRNTGLRTP